MSAKDPGNTEDESSKQVQASQPSTGPERRAHRRFSSSAFASSLSWDSDSEKEALDGNRRLMFINELSAFFLRVAKLSRNATAKPRIFSQFMLYI